MTTRDAHKNFAYSTVLTPPSPGVSGTSLVLQAGDGAKFPTPPFNATIWPIGFMPLATNAEIVRCTAIATDTLTIARAQEGSTARAVVATDQIAATITAKTITDLEADPTYLGDYAAGNFTDGDIVVYNNIAYLCCKPTSAAPTAWTGGQASPAGPPALMISYGTSLPGSPFDGQEAVLVDSLTAPSYSWRFRYNAGSTSPYKWEFIGGSPKFDIESVGVSIAATLGPIGPILPVPRPGVYLVEFHHSFYTTTMPAYIEYGIVGPYPPGTAMLSTTLYADRLAVVNEAEFASMRQAITITSAMSITGGVRYNENAITSVNRSLSITPVRVS